MSKLITLKNDLNINIINKINDFKTPEYVYLKVKNKDEFKINDYISKNDLIGNSYSPVSGKIIDIKKEYIIIQNDFKEKVASKFKKEKIKNIDDLYNILEKYKFNKLLKKIKEIDNINNLIVSSIDEEFYSAKEFMRLSNNYREILETTDLLMNIFKINNSLVVVKNTNYKGIKNVKSISGTYPNINITLAPDKYLISEPYFLCKFLSVKNEDSLILSASEIYDIYCILNGLDFNETFITISGNAIKESLVINTKIGVTLKEIIKEYIKIIEVDYEVFINGYLRGYKIDLNKDIIIDKSIYVIVINKKEESIEMPCINCGACNKICPYTINVLKCYYKKVSHKKCIMCGLCNYICPSNIKLKEVVKSD